jgi:hypothetical protein
MLLSPFRFVLRDFFQSFKNLSAIAIIETLPINLELIGYIFHMFQVERAGRDSTSMGKNQKIDC